MPQSPIYSTEPDIVDSHMYPPVVGGGTGQTQIEQVAALDYGDLTHFLAIAGLQSAQVMIGEAFSGTISPASIPNVGPCWNVPATAPSSNVAGFNQSSLSSHTVVFRPFMNLENASSYCYAYGNGPSDPANYQNVNYNGQGPYTPTIY